jgi:hypothetical protein
MIGKPVKCPHCGGAVNIRRELGAAAWGSIIGISIGQLILLFWGRL